MPQHPARTALAEAAGRRINLPQFLIFIGVLAFAIPSDLVMRSKGRSWFGGFVLGFILGPIGLLIVLIFRSRGNPVAMQTRNFRDLRKCPSCGEFISSYAARCRHCGNVVEPLASYVALHDRND